MHFLLYRTIQLALKLLFSLLTRRRVTGRENIPRHGPAIFVGNHIHLFDSPLLWVTLGSKAKFIAKEEMFNSRITGYIMRTCGVFPIAKERLDMKAFRRAMRTLSRGQHLVMFPEGMRSKNKRLKLAFPGAALMASRSGAPIVPVVITGTENLQGIKWLWRRPRISVHFGPSFLLPPVEDRLTKYKLAKLTDIIMESIAHLLPEEYHGQYKPRKVE
ncbi:MAG: 1-acyl-sn-glycerol-3-phosphate acyltransferase [Dehalococcoidales bacterium]|nr:1-acyl-sn-glycerol-3-phosphate acyltransferase [Dehalococcoidales bacterium]